MQNLIGEVIDTMENIEYGILIATVIVAVLLVVIVSINPKKKLSVLSYIIAVVLLIPLSFQMSRLIGACQISDTASAINDIVGAVSPTLSKYVSSATRSEVGWFIFRRIMWSLLFVGVGGFGIHLTMETPARNPRRKGSSRRRNSNRSYDDNF